MATRRKRFNPRDQRQTEPLGYTEFMTSLLKGEVVANKLVESRDGQNRLLLDYDDPNG